MGRMAKSTGDRVETGLKQVLIRCQIVRNRQLLKILGSQGHSPTYEQAHVGLDLFGILLNKILRDKSRSDKDEIQ